MPLPTTTSQMSSWHPSPAREATEEKRVTKATSARRVREEKEVKRVSEETKAREAIPARLLHSKTLHPTRRLS